VCGRFTLHHTAEEIAARFDTQQVLFEVQPRYNIAPSQPIATITQQDGARVLGAARWGLIPSWAKDPAIGNRMINARAETLREKPAFKTALARRRCLIPADGFYEWSTPVKEKGAKAKDKTPHYIRLRSGELFALAGLWDEWKSPDGETLRSCTIITTVPNEIITPLHHRMAVILKPGDEATWLDPNLKDADELSQLLQPYANDALELYSVSRRVNAPAFDDESCIFSWQEDLEEAVVESSLQPKLF